VFIIWACLYARIERKAFRHMHYREIEFFVIVLTLFLYSQSLAVLELIIGQMIRSVEVTVLFLNWLQLDSFIIVKSELYYWSIYTRVLKENDEEVAARAYSPVKFFSFYFSLSLIHLLVCASLLLKFVVDVLLLDMCWNLTLDLCQRRKNVK